MERRSVSTFPQMPLMGSASYDALNWTVGQLMDLNRGAAVGALRCFERDAVYFLELIKAPPLVPLLLPWPPVVAVFPVYAFQGPSHVPRALSPILQASGDCYYFYYPCLRSAKISRRCVCGVRVYV